MATIVDIAQAVGVTPTTVSSVIRGKGRVSAKMRARILATAEELGYQPNLIARSLKQGKTATLALVLPTVANPFYTEIAEEIERVARQDGYSLLLCSTHYDSTLGQQHLEKLVGYHVDGVIAMGGFIEEDTLRRFLAYGIPLVLCTWHEWVEQYPCPTVEVDYRHAGEIAAHHLLALGHRKIALVAEEHAHIRRVEGFVNTLQAAGVEMSHDVLVWSEPTLEGGAKAAQQLLTRPDPPTAIFATSDWMALGCIEAANTLGCAIPQKVSIVGFDGIMLSEHSHPTLTTVAVPRYVLAQTAMHLLMKHIRRTSSDSGDLEGAEIPQEHEVILIQPSLAMRHSSGVARTS